ncbi:hypothetical protein GPECTOR_3g337 [Gonium pectorale]|uniref:Uncharacterized protein n=1 Tax=Gonium pectorale TaxID=33097 RepID=A0A150GZP5_GONPE|nr:hypothetical protein GPECTOR_3g337 [Gonium pectorale]|eukprot:KXZ55192.1 hypothetical protein GPECTOR_3g337 [Gonium pectorale]
MVLGLLAAADDPAAAGGGGGAAAAFMMLATAAEAFARAYAGGGCAVATVLPLPPRPLTPPWGPCAQYLTLAAAVATLAAAGYGGGCDGGDGGHYGGGAVAEGAGAGVGVGSHCRGSYGLPRALARALWGVAALDSESGVEAERLFAVLLSMVEAEADRTAAATQPTGCPGGGCNVEGAGGSAGGSGPIAPGGWSFLVGPRAAHVLCMRIAHLAVDTGEAAAASTPATAGAAAGGGSPDVPPPQTPLLLHPRGARHLAARALAAARLRSSSAAAASDGCDLASIGRLPGAGLGGMLAVPGLGAGGFLPSSPPAALAPALSCGLLPALECCVRALGRSADPRDVGSLCELLRGSLLEQPGGLAAVLAFGPPGQAVPLLNSLAKVLRRCGTVGSVDRPTVR